MSMYKFLCMILFGISNIGYAKISEHFFDDIEKSYHQKKYGIILYRGVDLLHDTFQNIVDETLALLPKYSDKKNYDSNYSVDIQNNKVDFSLSIAYNCKYMDLNMKHIFTYSLEESKYYLAYIHSEHFNYSLENINIIFVNKLLGSYLWNDNEKTAYYVYEFPSESQTKKTRTIPGLLLKITILNPDKKNNIKETIKKIIENINWKELSLLYMDA